MRLLSDEFNKFFLIESVYSCYWAVQFNCEACWSGLTKSVTPERSFNEKNLYDTTQMGRMTTPEPCCFCRRDNSWIP